MKTPRYMPRLSTLLTSILLLVLLSVSAAAKDTWTKIQSKNFTIIGNSSEADLRKIAIHLEQFREAISILHVHMKLNSSVPTTVVVFKSDSAYDPFKPVFRGKTKKNIAGYFLPSPDGNYITLTTEAWQGNPYHVIFHEYYHFLVGNNMRHAPVWLNEGMADFYSTFETFDDDQKFKIGKLIDPYFRILNGPRFIPLKTLLGVDRSSPEYNEARKMDVFYPESWALVHYLMLGNQGTRRPQLVQFLSNLTAHMTLEENFTQSFKTDYKTLEKELTLYTRQALFPIMVANLTKPLVFDQQMQSRALSDAEVNYYLGDLLLHDNRLDEAEARLQKALDLDKNLSPAKLSMAILRIRQRRFDDARQLLQASLAADPQNYVGSFYYAEDLSHSGHDQEAIDYYKRAIAIRPDGANIHAALGFAYASLGQDKEAQSEFEQATRLDPASELFYHGRSFTYLSLGRGKLAATAAQIALQIQEWHETNTPYMVLTGHFGYRQAHQDTEADNILKKAATTIVDHTAWPYPVISYLRHEITAEQLLALATDNDKQTEAYTYLGLDSSLNGKKEEAVSRLQWVKDHGNKHFYEYPVALAELERLEKGSEKADK